MSREPAIRLVAFLSILLVMAAWEMFAPRRTLAAGRAGRWSGNLGLAAAAALLVHVLLPSGVVGLAVVAEARGWGLLREGWLPKWAAIVLSVVLLDLVIYAQHVLFHAVPVLWRLHRVHHSDLDVDATTGARFHPGEILLSAGLKAGAVLALGVPPPGALLFEVLLNATATFNHGNARIPERVDRVLRWGVVTPDMHRVHHSVLASETNANFGFNLPWWDRVFGTYRPQPAAGHEGMTLGLERFRDPKERSLARLLVQPFRDDPGPSLEGRSPTRAGARERAVLPRVLLAVALAGGIAWGLGHADRVEPRGLEAAARGLGAWAPVVFVVLYGVGAVLWLPASALSLAGGALFGPVWGTLTNLLGATLGATLAFLAARYLGADWRSKRRGDRFERLLHGVEAQGWRLVALIRLVPILPFNAVNYGLGLTRIPLSHYVPASVLGMLPGAVVYTYLGSAGWAALAGRPGAIPKLLLALGALAVLAVLSRLPVLSRSATRWSKTLDRRRPLAGAVRIARGASRSGAPGPVR